MKNLTAIFGTILIPALDLLTLNEVDNGQKDGKCKMGGVGGYFLQSVLIDGWLNQGHRCVLKGVPGFGTVQKRDGLKGLILNREVDMTVIPTTIHEINSTIYSHVRYTEPLTESFLVIGSGYRVSTETAQSSLMDAYLAFPTSFYVSIAATLVVFIISWTICSRMASKMGRKFRDEIRKARLSPSWIMICAILDQDQFPNVSKVSFTLLSLCFSTFFYFTIDCYMLNSMSTDLVVAIEPVVVRSLDDTIKRNDVKVLVMEGSDEETFFADAQPNTTESRIWNDPERLYKINSVGADLAGEIWMQVKTGKLTALIRDYIMSTAANLGLTTVRELGELDVRGFMHYDEKGRSFTQAMIINDLDASDTFKRFIHKRLLRLLQSHLVQWFVTIRIPQIVGKSDINIDRFVSKTLEVTELGLPLVQLHHTKEIYFCCSVLLIVAVIVLMFERFSYFVMKLIL